MLHKYIDWAQSRPLQDCNRQIELQYASLQQYTSICDASEHAEKAEKFFIEQLKSIMTGMKLNDVLNT